VITPWPPEPENTILHLSMVNALSLLPLSVRVQ
jgi:hypothetical protein